MQDWRLGLHFLINKTFRIQTVHQSARSRPLFTPTLLAVAVRAADWSPNVAIVMVIANILAIAFGKLTIKNQTTGGSLPAGNLFGGFSLGSVLGTTCFGHILGAGAILGLTNMGLL
jgi:photosystem I subunit X